jgi:site-specific DNA-methyltransferase (adenine-specific)
MTEHHVNPGVDTTINPVVINDTYRERKSTTPLKERDEARTPPSLFKLMDDRFHFLLDASCTSENCLTTRGLFIDTGYDALKLKWHGELDYNSFQKQYEPIFVNPPYSRGNIDRFIKKGYEESLKGATVVMLLPMDSSTTVFRECCMKASEWIIFYPRVKFLRPNGIPFSGSPKFGSFACVFKQDEFGGSPVVSSMKWK